MKFFKMAIIKVIKSKLFVGLFLLIVLTPTAFSKSLSYSLPYGWSKIKDMSNIKVINKKCEFDHSADYTNSDIEIFEKNCPLESISEYDIPENIKKEQSVLGKKIYLYQSDKFSLFLEEKTIKVPYFDTYYESPTTILFLERDGQIVDELTVSWHLTREFGFTNELSYYIDKKFNIFIINHGAAEDGDWLNLWAHYKIDPQKIKFDAITVKTKTEQIDFPDNLTVFVNPDYDENSGQLCLEEELNIECSEPNTYIDYFNETKKNTALLVKKSKAPKNAFSLFKKKLDQTCITMPRFNNNEQGVLPYFKYVYLCEVKGLKQELILIEKELAKK